MGPSTQISTKTLIIGGIAVASLAIFAYTIATHKQKRKVSTSKNKIKKNVNSIIKTIHKKPLDIHLVMDLDGFNAYIAADKKNIKLGLKYGSKLIKINEKRVSDCSYEEIVVILQKTHTPITLKFVPISQFNKQWRKALQLKEEANEDYKNGLIKQAINKLSNAIDLHATNKVLYSNRILMHLKLQQYDYALNDCSIIRELDPLSAYVKGHYLRGLVLLNIKKYKNAMSAFQQVIKLQPTFKKAKDRFNECLEKEKEREELNLNEVMDIRKYDFVDGTTKLLVNGYIRSMQTLMDKNRKTDLIIPHGVNKICAVFLHNKERPRYPGLMDTVKYFQQK